METSYRVLAGLRPSSEELMLPATRAHPAPICGISGQRQLAVLWHRCANCRTRKSEV